MPARRPAIPFRALPGLALGIALVALLVARHDGGRVLAAVRAAGWVGVLLVVLLHLPQTVASALGWRALLSAPPRTRTLFALRWVREAVNALLPVAQVGGDLVRARLLARRGVPAAEAAAATLVDLALEGAAQVAFTLLGVALLLAGPRRAGAAEVATIAGAISAGLLAVLLLARHADVAGWAERVARRSALAARLGGDALAGLGEAVTTLGAQRGRLWRSGGWHLLSWALGSVELFAALRVLGLPLGLGPAFVIEALGQAIRSAGFLVPGALGVQEGGFVLLGGLFGVAPHAALALALLRRVRELALGLPGLGLWHRLERAAVARRPGRD